MKPQVPSRNCLINMKNYERGFLKHSQFQSSVFTNYLDKIKLCDKRHIGSATHSITWFSLESVEKRCLLAAKSNGTFLCADTLVQNSNGNHKILFNYTPSEQTKSSRINCIQWYPVDTGMFFTSGMDRKLKIWDTNALQVIDQYRCENRILSHHMSPLVSSSDKCLIAVGLDNGNICFADINTGSFIHTIKAHGSASTISVQWSNLTENIIASGGSDGRVLLWDVRSSKSFVKSFDYLANTVSTSSGKDKKSSSKKSAGSSKHQAHTGPIVGLSFLNNNGNYLLSLGKDNHIRLWNTITGQNTLVNFGKVNFGSVFQDICIQLTMTDFNGNCNNFVFVPNGRSLNMHNIFDGTLKNVFKGHFDAINCCLYHPLLNEIYTGSNDRNLLIWSPEISYEALEDVVSNKASLKRPCESNTFYQSKRKKEVLERESTSANHDNNGEVQQDLHQDNWSDED